MEESQENKPDIQENAGRNPDGTFKPGFSGNPKGRPIKNPLKDYSLAEFASWTDEQKRAFLNQISPIDRWKMTEGNPKNDVNLKANLTISDVLDKLENGQSSIEQTMENKPPLQDSEQGRQTDSISAE